MSRPPLVLQTTNFGVHDGLMSQRHFGTLVEAPRTETMMSVEKRQDISPRGFAALISRIGDPDSLGVTYDANIIRFN